MDRWWADRGRAVQVADLWERGDDASAVTGTAFLVLHSIGSHALDGASTDYRVGRVGLPRVLRSIDDDPLIGAVCKAFDDATGMPGYGAARVSQLKADADAGATTAFNSLLADKVPAPLAFQRVAMTYGLQADRAALVSKRMTGHDLTAMNAADRALMEYAGMIADAESEVVSKLESDQFKVGNLTRTVNRDEKGRFANQDKSVEAKQQRAKERRQSFMSAAARRRLQAEQKAGGAGHEATSQAALSQEEVLDRPQEAKAKIVPEEQQRQERIARRKKLAARASIAGKAHTAQAARVQAEAQERMARDVQAMHDMHAAHKADISMQDAMKATADRKKETGKKGEEGARFKAHKMPKMKTFDKGDPSSTVKTVGMTLPDNRTINVRAPMMMVPEAGQQHSAGMSVPDPVSLIALYAGFGNSEAGYEKARSVFVHRKRPDSMKVWQEVEDVHRYVNLLAATKGDVGRVMQIAEDSTKEGSWTMIQRHYGGVEYKETKRDIEAAERLGKSETFVWRLAEAQQSANAKSEKIAFGGRGSLWETARTLKVDIRGTDLQGHQEIKAMFDNLVQQRASVEDTTYIVGSGGAHKDYGSLFASLATDSPTSASRHPTAVNDAQMVRFVRAVQIYALMEPGGEQSRKSSKLQVQYPKVINSIGIDTVEDISSVNAEDAGQLVADKVLEGRLSGEMYEHIVLDTMEYRPINFPLRKNHTVLHTEPQKVLSAKEFDRNSVLGISLPSSFGSPPLPLMPTAIQHTPKDDPPSLRRDDRVMLNMAESWRRVADVGGGGLLVKNIESMAKGFKAEVDKHNQAEDEMKAAGKLLPPF